MTRVRIMVITVLLLGYAATYPVLAEAPPPDSAAAKQEAERLAALPPVMPKGKPAVDHSGRKERGHASYYAANFAGRKMANGHKMNSNQHVAASKTLPLGTTTKVTRLETGKTTTVTVQDRGPFVGGRVVDVSPKAAEQLDLKKQGVAPVEIAPIAVPQKDGSVKLGAGAAMASPQEVRHAVETTKAQTPHAEAETARAQ